MAEMSAAQAAEMAEKLDNFVGWNMAERKLAKRAATLCRKVAEGEAIILPCKQYQTVYYILNDRVYVGWYLAKVGETTHLICQDKVEMGICWATDGSWFLTQEEAERALMDGKDGSDGQAD